MVEDDTSVLDFSQQQFFAVANDGWLQGRYYGEGGGTVADMLKFDGVFDISPFEVGRARRRERLAFKRRHAKIIRLMELDDLLPRPFYTLSNGEMRRVLFARAVLKAPKKLILDDPMAGLDPRQRERMRKVIAALARDGVEIVARTRNADELSAKPGLTLENAGAAAPKRKARKRPCPRRRSAGSGEPAIEINDLDVTYGSRKLFEHFNWRVGRGEHWVLKGPNGSGKTTLMALICGDSPLAYANDVRVFGQRRGVGSVLAEVRSRIGMVSPEMQTYLGKTPGELIDEALAKKPELLILDEPCLNLDAADARRLLDRVERWLDRHPRVTAIVIAHRPDHVPTGFDLTVDLAHKEDYSSPPL